jgi:hypothetical protein
LRAPLEERGELGHGDTLRVLRRALRYVGPFRARFAWKLAFLVLSLLPLLVLPWPVKIVVDHVIGDVPLDRPTTPFPALLLPLVSLLEGRSPEAILLAMLGLQLALVVLLGAVGSGGAER